MGVFRFGELKRRNAFVKERREGLSESTNCEAEGNAEEASYYRTQDWRKGAYYGGCHDEGIWEGYIVIEVYFVTA